MPICKNCGSRLTRFDKDVCPVCGFKKPLEGVSSDTIEITAEISAVKDDNKSSYKPKSRKMAFLYSALLGFTGAPFYYLKYYMTGMIWLLANLLVGGGIFVPLFVFAQLSLLLSLLISIGTLYILNIILGFYFLSKHDLKDGRGEFLR